MNFLRKYNATLASGTVGADLVRVSIRIPDGTAYATSSEWVPASGDCKISKDGGTQANIATLPSFVNGSWEFTLSNTEQTAKTIRVIVTDAAVEPFDFTIETFGHASAMWPTNYDGAIQANTTQLAGQTVTAGAGVTFPSSVASQTSLDTVDDFLDTEIAAIKTKTDLIPADPADASDIAAAFSTVNTTLTAITGYVDTEVAAIFNRLGAPAGASLAADIAGISGGSGLDAAGVRAAIGLASANLGTLLSALQSAVDLLSGSTGSGADACTLNIKSSGVNVPDADVWITSDLSGTTVVAGTLQTNGAGNVTFLLDDGVTYYLWMQKDGVNSIRGQSFVAAAD